MKKGSIVRAALRFIVRQVNSSAMPCGFVHFSFLSGPTIENTELHFEARILTTHLAFGSRAKRTSDRVQSPLADMSSKSMAVSMLLGRDDLREMSGGKLSGRQTSQKYKPPKHFVLCRPLEMSRTTTTTKQHVKDDEQQGQPGRRQDSSSNKTEIGKQALPKWAFSHGHETQL